MFYVKGTGGEHICLGDVPVYDTCPRYGKEHELEEFRDHIQDYDLYGTRVYCQKCSHARQGRKVRLQLLKGDLA